MSGQTPLGHSRPKRGPPRRGEEDLVSPEFQAILAAMQQQQASLNALVAAFAGQAPAPQAPVSAPAPQAPVSAPADTRRVQGTVARVANSGKAVLLVGSEDWWRGAKR